MVTVRMQSEVFGAEDFHYDEVDQALDGIRRLVASTVKLNDGIERIIGIVVNEEARYCDADEEEESDDAGSSG